MKTLMIMRHAKSNQDVGALKDHDRPLNDRGKRDAPKMGLFLKQNNELPDFILASSATRAVETAKGVLVGTGSDTLDISINPDLYLCDLATYYRVLSDLPDDCTRALVISHNPGTASLIFSLTGKLLEVTTANIGIVTLDIDHWHELKNQPAGSLAAFYRPKEISVESPGTGS